MSLDDLGWRAGELTVHGKGGRDDRLPLPCDVGAALVAYLRSRPRVTTRAVFLRATAPTGAITSAGVTWAVHNACDRSGVPRAGAHRLRHTLATQFGSRVLARRGRPGSAACQGGDDRDLRH